MLPAEPYAKLRVMLNNNEGRRFTAYKDTLGITTIGVGRNIETKGLNADEIELMLTNDIEDSWHYLSRYPWFKKVDPVRQTALMDMMFDLGPVKFDAFKLMIEALSKGDWNAAATEAMHSQWAKEVHDRAARDAEMLETGEWPS